MAEKEKKQYINKVKNRILSLSPSVKEGLERECTKDDFYSVEDKAIGKGGFGKVWKVRYKDSDKVYVIKVMCKQNIIAQKMTEQINREIEIMYKINHPHIIKLINHFEDDQNLYLIMELGAKGQLFSLLNKYRHGFDQTRAAQYMREIISAVKYLHSFDPPIIHRDIKPENILLDENGRCKLADFGWSNYVNPDKVRVTFCGTPEYLAPEMVNKIGHDTSVDIWALGVLCFELLTGKLPFNGRNNKELFSNIGALNINWPENDFNPLAKNLIIKILKKNPKERPSLDEILTQPWFEKYKPILPVMVPSKISLEEYLLQHTISVKKKEVKDNINKIIQRKGQTASITSLIKKLNHSESINDQKINSINSNNAVSFGNNQIEQKENKENSNDEIVKEKIQNIVKPLNDIIENQKNMLAEMKKKNDKYVLELNQAKKDLSLKTEELKQIDVLNNQIEKYRVMSNDRISLLAQIEEKSNKILELNSKLKEKEEDIERITKINKSLNDKLKQDEAEIYSLKNKLSELNTKLNEYLKDKEIAVASVQNKYDLLQQKFINYTCSDEKNNKMNPANLIEIINDSLTEFCELFKNKIDKISSELKVIKDNMFNSDEQLSKTIEKINLELKEVIQNTQKNLEEGYKNSIIIIENEIKSKLQERFDWQNKHIDQLMEFKIKAVNLEIKVNSLEEKNKNLEDMANVKGNENENLNKLLAEKDEYINNLKFKVSDLDDFNKKLKNFILRGKSLSEFDEFLKELGKQ
jgi:serine/threonine protein kinase